VTSLLDPRRALKDHTWSKILSSHGASAVKGFTLPHVFQIGRVLPTNWYPPGESMGYMHIYAPPSPTVPSSVNVRAGLYLGTTSLCLHDRYIQIERHTMKRIVDVELYRLND